MACPGRTPQWQRATFGTSARRISIDVWTEERLDDGGPEDCVRRARLLRRRQSPSIVLGYEHDE